MTVTSCASIIATVSVQEQQRDAAPLRRVSYSLGVGQSLVELAGRGNLLRALVVRDLRVRYRNSALGFFWSLLTPLFQMVILTFVVKYAMQVTIPNLSVKILAGVIAWAFFESALLDSTDCIVNNRDLVKKIYFPRPALPLAAVLGNLIHFVLSLLVLCAWLFVMVPDYRPTVQALYLLPLIAVQTVMVAGLGLTLAALHTFYHDIKFALMQLLRVLFFLTPVMYPGALARERLTEVAPWMGWAYMYNPMATLIESYRDVLMEHRPPEAALLLPIALFAVLVFVGGYRLFLWLSWRFPEAI